MRLLELDVGRNRRGRSTWGDNVFSELQARRECSTMFRHLQGFPRDYSVVRRVPLSLRQEGCAYIHIAARTGGSP